jgi:RNA polymerase sigma-70 factor, ECF subfamily
MLALAMPEVSLTRPPMAELFAENVRFVWRVLIAYGVREADAEDATQEVFMICHRRMEDWDPSRASARTWLQAISVRVAANYRRLAHVRRERAQGDDMPEGTEPSGVDDRVDQARLLAQLDLALETLDEKKRQVFVLHELEELPMAEVAEMVGVPVKTAYARLYAAREELAAALRRGAR